MGPLTIAMVMGLMLGVVSAVITVLRDSKKKKKIQKREDEIADREQQELLDLTLEHFDSLKLNWKKTVYTDEYGTVQTGKWKKEVIRFFKSVEYQSEIYTSDKVATLMGKFIEEYSKELEEKK